MSLLTCSSGVGVWNNAVIALILGERRIGIWCFVFDETLDKTGSCRGTGGLGDLAEQSGAFG